MEFNNIERNILYLLGNAWLKSGSLGPFDTCWIFDRFSDIPSENVKDALKSIEKRGFVELSENDRSVSLKQKGLSKIKVIKLDENGQIPIPRNLEK